jgi:uncharacterized protein YgbK (DUF1537 family)
MRRLGCIADDFTGATDVASVLASVGRDVVVAFGPQRLTGSEFADADAVVIALKSRTAPVGECVSDVLDAARALRAWGATQFYLKYCSTFDSTSDGNIGPSIDALLAELGLPTALAAPSYPANGRTVYQGHLFVGHERLDESPMRDHPLTPMRDSQLRRLLEPQTALPVANLFLDEVRAGAETIREALAPASPRTVIADATDDDDLRALARASAPHVLLTGGAGLALGLGAEGEAADRPLTHGAPQGGRLVVSGSASSKTRSQIAHARSELPSRKLDLRRLAAGESLAPELADWVVEQWATEAHRPVLVYATDSLDDLAALPADERAGVADRIERTLADLAAATLDHGLGALLVAGGETSGRVVQTLGIDAIRIGPQLAPGVVWAEAAVAPAGAAAGDGSADPAPPTRSAPAQTRRIAIALKSGNFGDERLFTDAWEQLR